MNKKGYYEEQKGLDCLLAENEASRCLLCYDAPCSKLCPAGTNPAKFIRSIRFKNLYGAAYTVRINNPLAGICARVCPTSKLCESGCIRAGLDKPINIGGLQRFLTDFERSTDYEVYDKPIINKDKVAIIGAGPAGISAANVLALNGYDVTIYEKNSKAGGYLTYGIPEFRLPQDVVDYEIKKTLDLGVKVKYNLTLGKDFNLADLKKDYKAVILATGYEDAFTLPMFDNNKHVTTAVDFLASCKSNKGNITIPNDTLIIGGGDVAMDVATSLKKLGAKSVTVVARETLDVFPATDVTFDETIRSFASIIPGFTPLSVQDNTVLFKRVDGEGTLSISADLIVLAMGQRSHNYDLGLDKVKNDYVTNNYHTNDEMVFACGDITEGDKLVVSAVKKGKECANAVIEYLEKGDQK